MNNSHLVKPKSKVLLSAPLAEKTPGFHGSKEDAHVKLDQLRARLDELQEVLYAEAKHKILIVLQAMDTGGKDGTIRFVFQGINPQGVEVVRFKVPTDEELSHDYLWRAHAHVPPKGHIVVFNRSHYEDVVTVGVHGNVSPKQIQQRYHHINEFERMLTDEGTIILKFFLHISKDEQKRRLTERLEDPRKHWKFSAGDISERKVWSKYTKAYEDAIAATSTPWAPWHVIPANKNWYRNLMVLQTLVSSLESLNMRYPKLAINPRTVYFT